MAPSGLSVFVIVSRSGSDGQLLQPSGQPFELLVCAEFVQAGNADLNRLGVVVGDTVDLFAAVRGCLQSHSWQPCLHYLTDPLEQIQMLRLVNRFRRRARRSPMAARPRHDR